MDLKRKVMEVFHRYTYRSDIEEALCGLGYTEFFCDKKGDYPDDLLLMHKDNHTLIFISYINATYYFYEKTDKGDFH